MDPGSLDQHPGRSRIGIEPKPTYSAIEWLDMSIGYLHVALQDNGWGSMDTEVRGVSMAAGTISWKIQNSRIKTKQQVVSWNG